jgi:hypothetical protein
MKKLIAFVPLLILCSLGYAEARIDDFNLLAPPNNSSLNLIIEHGNLEDANNFLFSPVCTGVLQSPALITDLNAFFEGYTGTRVINRGNGRYLLMPYDEFTDATNSAHMATAGNRFYVELEFSSVTDDTFILRATPPFFTNTAMNSSSCLARVSYEVNHATS